MDDRMFGVFSTIFGLSVGWVLNELSFTFKSNLEDRKILNQILFVQFEIRDVIKKTNLDVLEDEIAKLFERKFQASDVILLKETVGKVLYVFLQNELNAKFSHKICELVRQYKIHITALSQIDPYTTYYISNKDVIWDYMGYIDRYLSSIEPYFGRPSTTDEISDPLIEDTFSIAISDIRGKITPFLRDSALETIEEDIRLISRRIGYFRFFETNRFLKRTNRFSFKLADIEKIENFLDS